MVLACKSSGLSLSGQVHLAARLVRILGLELLKGAVKRLMLQIDLVVLKHQHQSFKTEESGNYPPAREPTSRASTLAGLFISSKAI